MAEIPSSIGPYRVEHLLGEGGMGAVYAAVHTSIERRVAIKVLHPEFAVRAEFVGRFFNEARAVNRVDHPGLVQISDYGQQPDGTAYIVMEYLRGQSLSARLKQEGALRVREALRLGFLIADALAAAHQAGIVHRGLMPRRERHRFFSLESLSLGKPGKRARDGQSRAGTCTALSVSTKAGKRPRIERPAAKSMGPSSALASMSSVRTPPRIQHLPHM